MSIHGMTLRTAVTAVINVIMVNIVIWEPAWITRIITSPSNAETNPSISIVITAIAVDVTIHVRPTRDVNREDVFLTDPVDGGTDT